MIADESRSNALNRQLLVAKQIGRGVVAGAWTTDVESPSISKGPKLSRPPRPSKDPRKEKKLAAEIRFITYLAPSIPRELYEHVVRWVGKLLGVPVSLRLEMRTSGPPRAEPDPFTRGEADVGFMCSPSFLWLRETQPPPVELLEAAPVFLDERAGGEPVYFSDVIVRRQSACLRFDELRGRVWAYNDTCSLSGYYNMLRKLAELGREGRFVERVLRSGSHLKSIDMVIRGEADAAAIDSNVLLLQSRNEGRHEGLRVLESWGPFPIQPVVVRRTLDEGTKVALARALLALDSDTAARADLAAWGLRGFRPIAAAAYEGERELLQVCEAWAQAEGVEA